LTATSTLDPDIESAARAHSTLAVVVVHARHYTRRGYSWRMPGYTKDKQKIATRLRRIEGQVRGIQKMIEEDRYCIDVLTQVNATRAALESVALQLLADHTEHCVTEAIRSGRGTEKVRELNGAVQRLVRS
jgi:DNA-binding FrmR family transcriptional regulator